MVSKALAHFLSVVQLVLTPTRNAVVPGQCEEKTATFLLSIEHKYSFRYDFLVELNLKTQRTEGIFSDLTW